MAYRRLPEVLAEHTGAVKVLHTLRPFAAAMAGEGEFSVQGLAFGRGQLSGNQGAAFGSPAIFALIKCFRFSPCRASAHLWLLLRCAAYCEINVGWHAGMAAARREYPAPAACSSQW
jgi:hypothetical protein